MKRATLWAGLGLGIVIAIGGGAVASAAPPAKAAVGKDAPVRANPALKAKIEKRIGPFKMGMSTAEVFAALEKEIDQIAAEKVAKAYNPKMQAQYEREAEKKKKDLRTKLFEFKGGGGVSGYEVKAPGEFTYRNNEAAIEVPRPGGGERQLFFVNDRLWKVYDHVALTGKEAELGDTWDSAIAKLSADLGDKGKTVARGSTSPSYYGVMIAVPDLVLWSDGTTQIRLVDHTKREDMTVRTVGIAYEDLATVEKLPALRANVEKKAVDAAVEKAGKEDPPPPKDEKKKK
jgi:hypothetical protein